MQGSGWILFKIAHLYKGGNEPSCYLKVNQLGVCCDGGNWMDLVQDRGELHT